MSQGLYRMHDVTPSGMISVNPKEAHEWNKQGFGIFVSVNSFKGPRRKENLKRIVAWAVDLDTGTKSEMEIKIQSGLTPSLVVESKRGYHVWWRSKDGEPQYWDAVMLDRLVPFYGADKNARDICRVLRMPGFNHMKNPAEPFLIKKVFEYNVSYTQNQMANFYPDVSKPEREEFKREITELKTGANFWEKVWRLDCIDGLERLSGSPYVNNETYSFSRNANGKFNISVNGKGTSCFIDHEFRIGSSSKGGPTLFSWLRWYGHSGKEAVNILKEMFPELETSK